MTDIPGEFDMDVERLRSWIGREEIASELLTSTLVQRFNATFDWSSPLTDGAETPLMIHFCLGQPAVPTAELASDGHPARGRFLPPVPLPRRMWAGGTLIFHGPILIGEVVHRRSVIHDVKVKHGRSGTLCFVTVGHEIHSGDRHAITECQDIVYRSAESDAIPQPMATSAPEGPERRILTPSPALLFRYSALTFNSHRIHYDAPYANVEEHYAGLVLHGPLQATLLANFAAELRSSQPRQFTFRSTSPIFATSNFSINAVQDVGALKLWTASVGGAVAMEASAKW